MDCVILELRNFNFGTKVTGVARALGNMLNLHGGDWNSISGIFARPRVEVRSVTIYVKLQHLSYYGRLRQTRGVVAEADGSIYFKFNNRKIRGSLLREFTENILQLSETCKDYHLVAALPRARADLKDLLIALERHFSHGLDLIYSITVCKRKFYIAFKRETALEEFLTNYYFRRISARSENLFRIQKGPLISHELTTIVEMACRTDW